MNQKNPDHSKRRLVRFFLETLKKRERGASSRKRVRAAGPPGHSTPKTPVLPDATHPKEPVLLGGGAQRRPALLASSAKRPQSHCEVQRCQDKVIVKEVEVLIVDQELPLVLNGHCDCRMQDCQRTCPPQLCAIACTVDPHHDLLLVPDHVVVTVPLVKHHCLLVVMFHAIVQCHILRLDCAIGFQVLAEHAMRLFCSHQERNAVLIERVFNIVINVMAVNLLRCHCVAVLAQALTEWSIQSVDCAEVSIRCQSSTFQTPIGCPIHCRRFKLFIVSVVV
eukprot:899744-Amphidinium_carterae.1